jgi:hypothetical protein
MTSTVNAFKNLLDGRPAIEKEDTTPSPQLLAEAQTAKQELRSKLARGIWVVEFTKVGGEAAIMECTLDHRHLPPGDVDETSTPAAQNPLVLRVFAVDRDGWRSFRVLNVTRCYELPESL